MDYEKKKVVWIDKKVHDSLKEYCKDNGLKMKFVVEKGIEKQIQKQSPSNG